MKINRTIFLHGSDIKLSKGTELKSSDNYEEKWSDLTSYEILEKFRPDGVRPQKDSVFCVGCEEDLEYSGGGEEFVFVVKSIGKVTQHDMNWATEVSILLGDDVPMSDTRYEEYAKNYWHGESAKLIGKEPVWEFMMDSAQILKVFDFDTEEDLDRAMAKFESKISLSDKTSLSM